MVGLLVLDCVAAFVGGDGGGGDRVHVVDRLAEVDRLFDRVVVVGELAFDADDADIGDAVLDAWMIKPINFDPQKKYPVIFHVYGEPAGSTVQDNWGTGDNLWHQYLANEIGCIVVSIDNRGTKVPRGRDFRKSFYRQIGLLAADDQAAAAKKIMQQ